MVKVEEVEVAGGFENDEIAACAEVLFNFVDGREIPYNPNPNINSRIPKSNIISYEVNKLLSNYSGALSGSTF